jgi:hypothetical protein
VKTLALALTCSNPDCDSFGEVIEELELDVPEVDGKVPGPEAGKVVVQSDEEVECDDCDTTYKVPRIKIIYK